MYVLQAPAGMHRVPVLGRKRSEKEGLGHCGDLQARDSEPEAERRLPTHYGGAVARVPGLAPQSDPWGQIHTPTFPCPEPGCRRHAPSSCQRALGVPPGLEPA